MSIICHIRIFLCNQKIYFQVLYNNEALPYYHITKFPYQTDRNRRASCEAMLRSLIVDCNLLLLEGSSLLPEADRKSLLSMLSEYAIQQEIPLLLL